MASLVITHDTGMMHIAAAFKKPIVAIWGNTTPRFGMYPYETHHYNLQVNGLECRPCSRIGFDRCPKGHFSCMMKQNTRDSSMLEFIQKALS
jgi:ADP-heptose:LPS heptosyltransferase